MASEEKQRQLGRSLAAIAVLFLCFWAFSGPSLLVCKELCCPRTGHLSQPLPGSGCVELPNLESEWKP